MVVRAQRIVSYRIATECHRFKGLAFSRGKHHDFADYFTAAAQSPGIRSLRPLCVLCASAVNPDFRLHANRAVGMLQDLWARYQRHRLSA